MQPVNISQHPLQRLQQMRSSSDEKQSRGTQIWTGVIARYSEVCFLMLLQLSVEEEQRGDLSSSRSKSWGHEFGRRGRLDALPRWSFINYRAQEAVYYQRLRVTYAHLKCPFRHTASVPELCVGHTIK